MIETAVRTAAVGAGATLLLDFFTAARKAAFGVPGPDWRLVGRWIGHMRRGRFAHAAIARAEPVAGEAAMGWAAHYAIGIGFAVVLILAAGSGWLAAPSPWSALAVGLASVAAPFLIMQPAFGLGVAASRAARPWRARIQSLLTHAVFGLGLYLAGLTLAGFPA